MIQIGMFAETYKDKQYPSIFDSIHEKEPENKDKILYHLKHGIDTACEFQSNGVPVPEERCAHSNANGVAVPF